MAIAFGLLQQANDFVIACVVVIIVIARAVFVDDSVAIVVDVVFDFLLTLGTNIAICINFAFRIIANIVVTIILKVTIMSG